MDVHGNTQNNNIPHRPIPARPDIHPLNPVQRLFPTDKLAKHGMFTVQMRRRAEREKEL